MIGKATSPADLKAAQATAKSRLKVINGIVSEVAQAVTKLKKASEPPQARGKSKAKAKAKSVAKAKPKSQPAVAKKKASKHVPSEILKTPLPPEKEL